MTETHNHIAVRNWLYFSAFMVFCMAIIGAITRLTESGLSMVEWRPLVGAIPPLSGAEWQRVFDLYRETPEYQKINTGMALDEFKYIFFWEWFHRFWGRFIGLVYAVPLVFFWVKNMIPQGFKPALLGLLVLGGMQAVMGYIMVLSGLADRPSVSHYKLAAHLSLAFVIFGWLLWLAFSLSNLRPNPTSFCKRRHGWVALGLVSITIIWGAFMAGKDAGLVSSNWPHMYHGVMIPDGLFASVYHFFNSEEAIHFTHRWIAVLALFMVVTFAWRVESFAIGFMVFVQFALGIATVMSYVAIPLAAMHQGGAFILVALMLSEMYRIRRSA